MIYLAYIEGPRGSEPQLWYRNKPTDHFVTPSDLKVLAGPTLLPDGIATIDAALAWTEEHDAQCPS